MIQLEHFSVYNNLLTRPSRPDNPLHDLLPDHDDRGWSVARNLIKPLNHLDFTSEKKNWRLNQSHNKLTPPPSLM
jgi:hypothetical protein